MKKDDAESETSRMKCAWEEGRTQGNIIKVARISDVDDDMSIRFLNELFCFSIPCKKSLRGRLWVWSN